MKTSVVIATCNRSEKANALVNQMLSCSPTPDQIVVVDSSDQLDSTLEKNELVLYIKTDRKNQPYQRYLGCLKTTGDVIIFLDDDVKILNDGIFDLYTAPYHDNQIAGVAVGLKYESISEDIQEFNFSDWSGCKRRLLWSWWSITGNPPLRAGEIYYSGLVGAIPHGYSGRVKYFQGPNMSFRKKIIMEIFNDEIFELYDGNLGKGEDKILSMQVVNYGQLLVNATTLSLLHPKEESHYLKNRFEFAKRTSFSRLILTKYYCITYQKSLIVGGIHFIWFSLWRLFFTILRTLFIGSKGSSQILIGQVAGFLLAIKYMLSGKFKH